MEVASIAQLPGQGQIHLIKHCLQSTPIPVSVWIAGFKRVCGEEGVVELECAFSCVHDVNVSVHVSGDGLHSLLLCPVLKLF